MRQAIFTSVLCNCLAFASLAQSTTPALTATTVPVDSAAQAIPRDELLRMFQAELADKFDPAQLDRLPAAHELIERYFQEPASRRQLVTALEASGVEPNVLGRIARIRARWPELAGGVYYINEKFGPYTVKYFLGIPAKYNRTRPWPLVVKLPAADAFVREPKPHADQVAILYHRWTEEELARHPDAICILPLLNLDELYGPGYAGMHTVIQPLMHACDRVNIDPAGVYLVGHSMSAHATWNLALHYPTYFAAFNALAGGASAEFQRVRLHNLRNVLPVVWHDADDKVIKVDASRTLARILKSLKIDFDYEETRGLGHVPTEETAEERYATMRKRTRELYPIRQTLQSNRPDVIFNRIDWLQVYQPMNAGEEQWLFFRRGYGHMITYSNTFKADAAVSPQLNRIDVTADNVGLLRIYLNDKMVDFRKPVMVVVNKRGVFEAMVNPSVKEMLHDQLILGRGWRYFTGVIDVDLMPKPATRATTRPSTSRPTSGS